MSIVNIVAATVAVARESMVLRGRPAVWSEKDETPHEGETAVSFLARLAFAAFAAALENDLDGGGFCACSRPIFVSDGTSARLDLSPNSRRIELVLQAEPSRGPKSGFLGWAAVPSPMYVDDGWSLQINQQALSLLISACWQGRVILPQDHERQMAFIAGLTQTSDYAGLRQLLVADNSYMVADTDSFNFEVALGRLVAEYDGADHGADGIAYLAGMPAPAGIADQTPERLLPFLPEAVEAAVLDGTLSTATVDEHIARRRQADLQRELEAIYSDHHHTSAYLQRTFLGRLADAIRGYDPDLRIVAGGEPSYADGKWILDLKVEDTSGANPPEPLSEWLLFGGNVHPPLSALSAEWWAGHQVAYDLDNTWRVLAKASKEA